MIDFILVPLALIGLAAIPAVIAMAANGSGKPV